MTQEVKEMKNLHLSPKEKQFLDAVKQENLNELKLVLGEVNVNCQEEDGMTALMFAAYKGNAKITEYLLGNGATVNNDVQKDGYTPLMFATLAGSTEVVRMLLEAGAKPGAVNKVNRTASQLGAFIGRHDCVTIINNFVQQDDIKYYTKKHGLQDQPKLKEYIAPILHKYMMIPNMNPIKVIFFIQQNKELVNDHKSVVEVMDTECQKAYKGVNEIFALKVHLLCCVLKKAVAWENGDEGKNRMDGLLKFLLKGRSEDGFLINIENFLRGSLKSFPHCKSNIFQQLVKTLAKVQIGNDPTALAAITQSLNGIQSADFSECCTSCSDRNVSNKCSVCKSVRYCNARCQKLHWSTHKQYCTELKIQFELIQEELKKRKEKEAAEKEAAEKEAAEKASVDEESGELENGISEINLLNGDSEGELVMNNVVDEKSSNNPTDNEIEIVGSSDVNKDTTDS